MRKTVKESIKKNKKEKGFLTTIVEIRFTSLEIKMTRIGRIMFFNFKHKYKERIQGIIRLAKDRKIRKTIFYGTRLKVVFT